MDIGESNSNDLGLSVWDNMEKVLFDLSRGSSYRGVWVMVSDNIKMPINNLIYRSVKTQVEHSIIARSWR